MKKLIVEEDGRRIEFTMDDIQMAQSRDVKPQYDSADWGRPTSMLVSHMPHPVSVSGRVSESIRTDVLDQMTYDKIRITIERLP